MIPVLKLSEVNQTWQNVENANVKLSLADMYAIFAVPSQIRRLMNGTTAIGGTDDWILLRCNVSTGALKSLQGLSTSHLLIGGRIIFGQTFEVAFTQPQHQTVRLIFISLVSEKVRIFRRF